MISKKMKVILIVSPMKLVLKVWFVENHGEYGYERSTCANTKWRER